MDIKTDISVEDIYYPKSKKFNDGYLDVGDGHTLYYFEFGNPDGPPVLLVHGGPGSGIEEGSGYTRHHDPSFFRIIAVDQRGCGQSKPHVADDRKAALHKNDPFSLARDFEVLRNHLNIDRWHVYGYSWGSCLGTFYAAHYPKSVLSLTIGGVWLHTPQEIDWYINYMGLFLPEAEQTLLKLLPKSVKRFDRLTYLYKAITGKDHKLALKIASAQGTFEFISTFFKPFKPKKQSSKAKAKEHLKMIALGALEIFFMHEHPLATNWYKSKLAMKALRSIKDFHIIQGRYDIICPPSMAYELHCLYPHSKLTMVQYAGHSTREPLILNALINANNRLKSKSSHRTTKKPR